MSGRHVDVGERVARFVNATVREDPLLRELREETARLPNAGMQIGPDQGALMALLVRSVGVRRYLEIGVFTGYSSLAVALALPGDGRITACDVSAEYTSVARRYWQRAGVAGKIDLRIAPAVQTLDALLAQGAAGTYDMAFIDADKERYDAYYERALQLVRPGGLIALDNMLWSGDVADPSRDDADTNALRALDATIAADERVDCALVPAYDGVMLARKR